MLETKCQENARAIAQQMKNGGSGSDVTVTQVLSSGTKIATITVGDTSTDLYCETVPTPETPISVTADGVKTYSQLLDDLFALIDSTKITESSTLNKDNIIYHIGNISSSQYDFGSITVKHVNGIRLKASGSEFTDLNMTTTTYTDVTSQVATANETFTIMY